MKLGLTSFQYSMLAHLESEGPLTFAELAAREHVSSGDVQRSLVVPIVLDGLVTETDHVGSDVASYALTPAGSRVLYNARAARQHRLAELIESGMDESERETLARAFSFLERLVSEPPMTGNVLP